MKIKNIIIAFVLTFILIFVSLGAVVLIFVLSKVFVIALITFVIYSIIMGLGEEES